MQLDFFFKSVGGNYKETAHYLKYCTIAEDYPRYLVPNCTMCHGFALALSGGNAGVGEELTMEQISKNNWEDLKIDKKNRNNIVEAVSN